MNATSDSLAPITSTDRIGELDSLRGMALFGVLLVHFIGGVFYEMPLDADAFERWFGDPIQRTVLTISDISFWDKANTLFAMLFGMGFWVQMERLEARRSDFISLYSRRLVALLVIGFANLLLIFAGDVLHVYALLGFALLLARKMPARLMLFLGLILAVLADPIIDSIVPKHEHGLDELEREVFYEGPYWRHVALMARLHFEEEIIGLRHLGWFSHLFGRFLLGAWLIRSGMLLKACRGELPLGRLVVPCLGAGLALEVLSSAIYADLIALPSLVDVLAHSVGALVLATGYAMALAAMHGSKRFAIIPEFFAPVGRTALTNYVWHGMYFWIFFMGFGFGFHLLGRIPPSMAALMAIGLFAMQVAASKWWLARYRYGPLEYLWRWATYGSRPKFSLQPAAA